MGVFQSVYALTYSLTEASLYSNLCLKPILKPISKPISKPILRIDAYNLALMGLWARYKQPSPNVSSSIRLIHLDNSWVRRLILSILLYLPMRKNSGLIFDNGEM